MLKCLTSTTLTAHADVRYGTIQAKVNLTFRSVARKPLRCTRKFAKPIVQPHQELTTHFPQFLAQFELHVKWTTHMACIQYTADNGSFWLGLTFVTLISSHVNVSRYATRNEKIKDRRAKIRAKERARARIRARARLSKNKNKNKEQEHLNHPNATIMHLIKHTPWTIQTSTR